MTVPGVLSVVIPAWNEAARLPAYLDRVLAFLDARAQPYEVIVVDDGSVDGTAALVREAMAAHPPLRLHVLAENRGKGHAVRIGMGLAGGSLRLMTDADGATPIVELARLEAAVQAGADVAVGSRALADPGVTVRARLHRRLAGGLFNWLVRVVGMRGVADTQCGFKLFRGAVAEDLFGRVSTDGFGFDVEVLLWAQARGYRIAEVPVNWADQSGSKVGVLRDGPRMLLEILRARARVARAQARAAWAGEAMR
jgi:dolichyl-phosphate beta-glucosyltransferase